jgi:YVTN family beta-propeller protein
LRDSDQQEFGVWMRFSRLAAVACAAVFCLLISGCGDTFRPVATPLPQSTADPQTFRLAVFISGSAAAQGQVSDVNAAGDTISAVTPVGTNPVFALAESSRVVTADLDSDTVTSFSQLTLSTSLSILGLTTTTLPKGARPTSLADANNSIFVGESGRGVVGVLAGSPLALTTEIPVGGNPVALAALPSGQKVYAVNQSSSSVTAISTADNTLAATVTVGSNPVWAVASSDSTRVYVINQGSNSVSVIDAATDTLISTVTVGSAPNYAVFDAKLQRLLVTNPGSNTLSVINADPVSPAYLTVSTVNVGSGPTSVTALANGTKIYVANKVSNNVTVINSTSLAPTSTIPVGTTPVWIASDSPSAKVFVANTASQNFSIIQTSNDSEVKDASGNAVRLPAPNVDPTCTGAACVRQTPVFVAVTPS